MAKKITQLDELDSIAGGPGEVEGFFLDSRLRDLVRASQGIGHEQAHDVFFDFCKQATAALELHRGALTESPSAPTLLEYLVRAMSSYVKVIDSLDSQHHTTADRRQALAEAFMLTGKRTAGISEQQRIEVCHAFSCSIAEQTVKNGAQPTSKQLSIARRRAYQVYWGVNWIADDDTSKSRMKQVTSLLQAEGFDPGKVTFD